MRYFIILFFVMSNSLFSQEISAEEYKIYAQILDELNYPSNKFHLGLSPNTKASLLNGNDPIESEIGKLNADKTFYLSKLDSYIVKFRQDKLLNRENYHDKLKDRKLRLICSNIYFKNDTEAYVYGIAELKNLKPMQFLFIAKKGPDGYWCLEDYTFYY